MYLAIGQHRSMRCLILPEIAYFRVFLQPERSTKREPVNLITLNYKANSTETANGNKKPDLGAPFECFVIRMRSN